MKQEVEFYFDSKAFFCSHLSKIFCHCFCIPVITFPNPPVNKSSFEGGVGCYCAHAHFGYMGGAVDC